MPKLTILKTITAFSCFLWFGQQDLAAQYLSPAAPGTFQIIQNSKVTEAYTEEFMDNLRLRIEANRDEYKEIFIEISKFSRVRILPRKVISDPSFVPVEEVVIDKSGCGQ